VMDVMDVMDVMRCGAVRCGVVWFSPVRCGAVRCNSGGVRNGGSGIEQQLVLLAIVAPLASGVVLSSDPCAIRWCVDEDPFGWKDWFPQQSFRTDWIPPPGTRSYNTIPMPLIDRETQTEYHTHQ